MRAPKKPSPRRRRPKKPKAATQRRPDIRKIAQRHINSLIGLYEETDPALGATSEDSKIERARQAISIWWYLYAELMLWAQSQLTGYEFVRSNTGFLSVLSEEFGEEPTRDSHLLEYIGLQWSWNHVNYDDPMSERVQSLLEDKRWNLDETALRMLIRELLMSRSANSSFWRFELQHALFHLNLGHVDPLVKPNETRRQGNPAALFYWKARAIHHVYFQVGKGLKKYRAQQLVADAIGQSVETLRSWEKTLSQQSDDDFTMEIEAANIAGQLEEELDEKSPFQRLEQEFGARYHRHSSNIDYARMMLSALRRDPLKDVKDGLRKSRATKHGS